MRSSTRRLAVLLFGASVGAIGWGAVLPFLYADIANARGLGAPAAAVTFSFFALGALLAAPAAGRLADRSHPVVVATVARLAMVLAIVALMYAAGAVELWLAALAYGAALAVVQPSISVLVLDLTPAGRRRDAFAWQFIGQNLGLAIGGMVGGYLVDLSEPTGSRPAYAFAAVCSAVSAALVVLVGRGRARGPALTGAAGQNGVDDGGYRAVLAAPGVRWMLAVTGLLTLACYAQFDSGLPAYALSVLDVAPTTLGTAVAVNAVLVAALTAPVVRATRRFAPTTLLATCAVVWIGVWLVLAAPMLHVGSASALVVAGYALFSVGETMLAPVLTPLAASLAPSGATGRTLAAMSGAQTLATAIGPGLSGVLLALGLPVGFVVMQLTCCVLSIMGARHLARAVGTPRRGEVVLAR